MTNQFKQSGNDMTNPNKQPNGNSRSDQGKVSDLSIEDRKKRGKYIHRNKNYNK